MFENTVTLKSVLEEINECPEENINTLLSQYQVLYIPEKNYLLSERPQIKKINRNFIDKLRGKKTIIRMPIRYPITLPIEMFVDHIPKSYTKKDIYALKFGFFKYISQADNYIFKAPNAISERNDIINTIEYKNHSSEMDQYIKSITPITLLELMEYILLEVDPDKVKHPGNRIPFTFEQLKKG